MTTMVQRASLIDGHLYASVRDTADQHLSKLSALWLHKCMDLLSQIPVASGSACKEGHTRTPGISSASDAALTWPPVEVVSLMELGLPVASRPSTTLVTSVMSTTPRGLLDGLTSDSPKRNSQPSLSTNQRRRQVLITSPWENSQPVFSGDFQNSTSSQVGSCRQP